MDFTFYVKLIGIGGQISCEGFNTIEEARDYVASDIVPILAGGDNVVIEEYY